MEKLNESFRGKGCEIVSILLDGDEAEGLSDALDIIAGAGATYTMLKPFAGVSDVFPAQAVPTSYFVDAEGRIHGEPIVGAYVEGYESTLDSLLAQMG